jgi:hypothetical protein
MNDPRDQQIAKLTEELTRLRILNEAATAHDVKAEAIDDLAARLMRRFTVGSDGNLKSTVDEKETVADYLQTLQTQAPHLFGRASVVTKAVQRGENPWKEGSLNLTRQGEILRANPALAHRLAAEAGQTIPDLRPRKKTGRVI